MASLPYRELAHLTRPGYSQRFVASADHSSQFDPTRDKPVLNLSLNMQREILRQGHVAHMERIGRKTLVTSTWGDKFFTDYPVHNLPFKPGV